MPAKRVGGPIRPTPTPRNRPQTPYSRFPVQPHNHTVTLDTHPLSPVQVAAVARLGARVTIDPSALALLQRSRAVVEAHLSDGHAHYGINTGFGSLSRQRIAAAELERLQLNLVRSHAAGAGSPLPVDTVRGMLLLLAASLCRGCSGCRPELPLAIVSLLNAGLTPVVPSLGSVGASGDLAPLAHACLPLIGEGFVTAADSATPLAAADALATAGLRPISLAAKEGLALINGTHLMAASAALLTVDADRLLAAAHVACAMSIDACRATDSFLDPRVHAARRQLGQASSAARLRELLDASQIIPAHRENDPRVQDPYSFRCAPVVLGAAIDGLSYVKQAVANELGAVTDNPLIFAASHPGSPGDIVSAGNFHGMPLAMPLDHLAIVLAHIAGISERRTFWMLAATEKESGLRPYLAPRPAINSGFMIAQYTAAACCNELIGLCTPASVANISTSAGIEDYNSFGPRAAAKAHRALDLASIVVAIELLCAAQGLEFQRPLRSGAAVEKAHAMIRSLVPPLTDDRPPSPDIEAIRTLILSGAFADL